MPQRGSRQRRGFVYVGVAGFFGGITAVFLIDLLFGGGVTLSWIFFVLGLIAAAVIFAARRSG